MVGGSSAAFRSYDMLTEVGTVTAFRQDPTRLDDHFRAFCDRNPIKSSAAKVRREASLRASGLIAYTPGITQNTEWLSQNRFLRTDYYNEVYKPLDIHSHMSVGLAMQGTNWTGIDVYRSKSRGSFSADDLQVALAAVPHLARALKLGRRLSERQSAEAEVTAVFDQSPYGLFVVEETGRIRMLNSAGERLLQSGDGLCSLAGRLTAKCPHAAQRLAVLLSDAGAPDADRRKGGAMALSTRDQSFPLSITAAPVRPERLSIVSAGRAVLVCVTNPHVQTETPAQRLREAYSLTPAEIRVALALADGSSLLEAAEKFGVSLNTVAFNSDVYSARLKHTDNQS